MAEKDKKQGFLYGSTVLMMSALISRAAGALFRIPLAHILGGTGMGYFSSAYGLFMPVYAIAVTGLPSAAARLVSACEAAGERDLSLNVRRTAMKMFGIAGISGTILMILLSYPLCMLISGSAQAVPAVVAISPTVFLGCALSVYRGVYEGRKNMFPTAVSQVIEAIVKLGAGLALCMGTISLAENRPGVFLKLTGIKGGVSEAQAAKLPYAAAAAALGITISSLAGYIYLYIVGREHRKYIPVISKEKTAKLRKELLKTAVPAAIGALVINLTSLIDLATILRSLEKTIRHSPQFFSELLDKGVACDEMPNFIFGSFSGIAVTVFNLVPSVANMLGKGILPHASAAMAANDREKLGKCTCNVLFASAFISVPAGAGIAALGREIMTLLFSHSETEISVCCGAMRILGAAVPLVCLSSAGFSVLQAVGRADVPVKIMAVGAAVKLAGNLLLVPVPELGISGAALSTVICYTVIFVLTMKALEKKAELDIKRTMRILAGILPASAACGIGARFVNNIQIFSGNTSANTLAACFAGGIIYIIVTYFSGVITKSTLKSLI